MGLLEKGLRVWVQSRLDPCPKEQQYPQKIMAMPLLTPNQGKPRTGVTLY